MMRNWGILLSALTVLGGCEPPEEDVDFEIVDDDGKYDSASSGQWAGSPLDSLTPS